MVAVVSLVLQCQPQLHQFPHSCIAQRSYHVSPQCIPCGFSRWCTVLRYQSYPLMQPSSMRYVVL